jgi:hypothetical protein
MDGAQICNMPQKLFSADQFKMEAKTNALVSYLVQ